jgi:hypothetical protein
MDMLAEQGGIDLRWWWWCGHQIRGECVCVCVCAPSFGECVRDGCVCGQFYWRLAPGRGCLVLEGPGLGPVRQRAGPGRAGPGDGPGRVGSEAEGLGEADEAGRAGSGLARSGPAIQLLPYCTRLAREALCLLPPFWGGPPLPPPSPFHFTGF